MDAWWSEATQLQFAYQNGGTFNGGPYRGVIHTTEVKTYTPSTTSYYGHHNPPHFTLVQNKAGEVKFYQHFPINVAARALENRPGGVETNRRSAIQIEIAWKAAEINQLPDAMLQRLWDWMRWVETQTGVKSYGTPTFYGQEASGLHGVARMTNDQWNQFDSWCGHQHVPENTHWDPGKLNIDLLTRITRPGTPRCQVKDWF
jgi:hypothetical protein